MNGFAASPAVFPTRKARIDWEERANQLTHGLAALLSIAAAIWMMSSAAETHNTWLIVGCWIYAISLVLVYSTSALSHSFRRGWWKHTFRTLDQVSIFLLIVGNYTPVGLTIARNLWPVLLAMWILALAGIYTKLMITGIRNVPVWCYLAIGWMPLLAAKPILMCFDLTALAWIIAGGFFYTVGTFFLANDSRSHYYHPLWHLFVMAGSSCHFIVINTHLIQVVSHQG